MRTSDKALAASIIFGLLVWVLDAVMDYAFFYDRSFWALLIADIPISKVYFRIAIIVSFSVFGFIISGIMAKRQVAEKALEENEKNTAPSSKALKTVVMKSILAETLPFLMTPSVKSWGAQATRCAR